MLLLLGMFELFPKGVPLERERCLFAQDSFPESLERMFVDSRGEFTGLYIDESALVLPVRSPWKGGGTLFCFVSRTGK